MKTPPKARVRARWQASLMTHRGRRHRHLADDLGVSGRPIQRWLQASHPHRLAGLKRQGGRVVPAGSARR